MNHLLKKNFEASVASIQYLPDLSLCVTNHQIVRKHIKTELIEIQLLRKSLLSLFMLYNLYGTILLGIENLKYQTIYSYFVRSSVN